MRLLAAIKNDIRFQIRYGFYFLYAFLTLLYSLVLIFVPEKYREIVSFIVIASDPAMVGFFFIGAIWLLKKVKGFRNSLSSHLSSRWNILSPKPFHWR